MSGKSPKIKAPISTTGHGCLAGQGCLAGKVALITGAGRGIGRATAELFAKEGARLLVCSRTTRELKEVLSGIEAGGGIALGRRVDIGSAKQAGRLVRYAFRRFGRLDFLINNAGILGPRVPIDRYPVQQWNRVMKVNLSGTFYVTREVARVMAAQGAGTIISISSSVGRAGRAHWGAYAVSKFGVEGLSQVLAEELRASGVCVLTFNPGSTRTRMRAEAYPDEDRSRLRDPTEAAQALLHLAMRVSPAMSGRAFDLGNLP